jgi:hypothetical protein
MFSLKRRTITILTLGIALCAMLWMRSPLKQGTASENSDAEKPQLSRPGDFFGERDFSRKVPSERPESSVEKPKAQWQEPEEEPEDLPEGALADERTLLFEDEARLEAFLQDALAMGYSLEGRLDALRAVRLGLGSATDWGALRDLASEEEIGFNFPISVPRLPTSSSEDGSLGRQPVGGEVLKSLGLSEVSANWGQGVSIAILDNGVRSHEALNGVRLREWDLIGNPALDGTYNGHGTAVASLISGRGEIVSGVAPGADLMSFKVLDGLGQGNAFTVAEGIVKAVDNGAHIVSLSLGSYGDSAVLASAVAYAREKGVLLIASAGNDGGNTLTYPAAYDGVMAVSAVDAKGQPAPFSNSGEGIDLAAPGVDVHAAWSDQRHVRFTGTSAAAPLVAGSVATLMTLNPGLGALDAADILLTSTNEAGLPQYDTQTGEGMLNLERALQRNATNRVDLGLSLFVAPQESVPSSTGESVRNLYLHVENRGTANTPGTTVGVDFGGSRQNFPVPVLRPGEKRSLVLSLEGALPPKEKALTFRAEAPLQSNLDANPADNALEVILYAEPEPGP